MALFRQASATLTVKVGAGRIYGILVSSTSSGTLAVYDSATASTGDPKILDTYTPSASETVNFLPGVIFSKGLYVVAGNTISFTVIYE